MAERPDILNMRLDPGTRALMDELANRFGLSRTAVVRQAIRRWAYAEGVPVPAFDLNPPKKEDPAA